METKNTSAILAEMDPGAERIKALRAAEAAAQKASAQAEIANEEQIGGSLKALRDAAAQAFERHANAEKRRVAFYGDTLAPAHERYTAATSEHATLQAAAEDARRESDRLAGELRALETSAKSPYRFTGPNNTLDDASLAYALSLVRRDDSSMSVYSFAGIGRVGVAGDGNAWNALMAHEMRVPGADRRAFHQRLADALGV